MVIEKARLLVEQWLASDRTRWLDLSCLKLTELPDNFPVNFNGKLDCSNNQLTSLSLPMATSVFCSHNQLTSLSLPMATFVFCPNNQLTSLSLPMATFVRCSNNQLTTLSLPMATEVSCMDNQLTSLSLPMATYVCCYRNLLTTLSLPMATEVLCHDNPIEFRLSTLLPSPYSSDEDVVRKDIRTAYLCACKMLGIIKRTKQQIIKQSEVLPCNSMLNLFH